MIQHLGTAILLHQRAQILNLCGTQNIQTLKNTKNVSMQFASTRIFLFSGKKRTFDSVASGEIKVDYFLTECDPSPLISCNLTLVPFRKKNMFFSRML